MYTIKLDDLRGPEIAALLQDHLDAMHAHSPPESVFALDLDALRAPEITFWTIWDDDQLAGCGALKQHLQGLGEIKSMRTAAPYLRRGVAAQLLAHIIAIARTRYLVRLNLETGSGEPFEAACALYDRFGFIPCGPFADYAANPFSQFFTLKL
jgi:putative acetyltransferase